MQRLVAPDGARSAPTGGPRRHAGRDHGLPDADHRLDDRAGGQDRRGPAQDRPGHLQPPRASACRCRSTPRSTTTRTPTRPSTTLQGHRHAVQHLPRTRACRRRRSPTRAGKSIQAALNPAPNPDSCPTNSPDGAVRLPVLRAGRHRRPPRLRHQRPRPRGQRGRGQGRRPTRLNLRRRPPLRFGRLLLASLDNRFSAPAPQRRPSPDASAVRRCASAGSYSLRSTIGSSAARGAGRAGRAVRRSAAALRPAPTRFARQSVLRRSAAPAEPAAPARSCRCASAGSYSLRSTIASGARCARRPSRTPRLERPLRFGRLLLASLDNRFFGAAAAHGRAGRRGSCRPPCASAGSYSLRSTIGSSAARQGVRSRRG